MTIHLGNYTERSQTKLSSRPERSEVEGSALRPSDSPYSPWGNCSHAIVETPLSVPKQNCHPDRSVAKWRDLRCAPRPSQILRGPLFPRHRGNSTERPQTKLSSRPERSEVEGSALRLSAFLYSPWAIAPT